MTKEDIENEVRALDSISKSGGHSNIVTVLEHGWLVPVGFYYIDMELCDLTLSEYIHDERAKYIRNCNDTSKLSTLAVFVKENSSLPLKLQNLWTIMNQIARGVDFIHKQHQVHGDLKPRNGTISLNSHLTP